MQQLLTGIATRFALSCAGWCALRLGRALIKSGGDTTSDIMKKSIKRQKSYLKIWCASFGAEVAVSMVAFPGYVVAKSCMRVMMESFTPSLSDVLYRVDRFNYFALTSVMSSTLSRSGGGTDANNNSSAFAVSNCFVWHLPATALTLAKLCWRVKRHGMRKTRFFRCLGTLVLQYVVRVPMMSFATMLPMSDSEMLQCALAIFLDKLTDAYLMYNTWPLDDE